jgi:hypothetical protein
VLLHEIEDDLFEEDLHAGGVDLGEEGDVLEGGALCVALEEFGGVLGAHLLGKVNGGALQIEQPFKKSQIQKSLLLVMSLIQLSLKSISWLEYEIYSFYLKRAL